MYRSDFISVTPTEHGVENNCNSISTEPYHDMHPLPDSSSTLLPVPSDEGSKRSWPTSARTLRLSSVILHSNLIAIHLTLLGIWAGGLEHRLTVSLEHQKIVSFLITASTTTFGTVFSALLVFVTQTLSARRSLRMDQMLTATHDNAAAWAGVGAAVSHLWLQRKASTRASAIGVLSAALYLGTILALHITASSLFSLVTLNSARTLVTGTLGFPAYNRTPDQSAVSDMELYAAGSLYFLPAIFDSVTSLGLQEGTLYDVLDNPVVSGGNAIVNATGFDISCGYLEDLPKLIEFVKDDGIWRAELGSLIYEIPPSQPGIISLAGPYNSSILLFSTIPIVDSSGKNGSWINLTPPMNTSVSSIQLLECSLSLVKQKAIVDAVTREINTVEPDFKKTTSSWIPSTALENPSPTTTTDNATSGNLFIDSWATWYNWIPGSDYKLDYESDNLRSVSVADMYLIQKLNLPAANHTDTQNVTLHDLENALSVIVASMFWTLGHISPTHRAAAGLVGLNDNGTIKNTLADVPAPPILLPGTATVTETFVEARLELSIIAVLSGLAVSMALFLISSPLLLFPRGIKDDKDLPIEGSGLLQTIWLYRNHPELETLLEQVEHPTEENLRVAGMVRARLVGAQSHQYSSSAAQRARKSEAEDMFEVRE